MIDLEQLKRDIKIASACGVSPNFWKDQVKLLKDASDRAVKANESIKMSPEKMRREFTI